MEHTIKIGWNSRFLKRRLRQLKRQLPTILKASQPTVYHAHHAQFDKNFPGTNYISSLLAPDCFWGPFHLKHKRSDNPKNSLSLSGERWRLFFSVAPDRCHFFDDSATAVSPSLALAPTSPCQLLMVCQKLLPKKALSRHCQCRIASQLPCFLGRFRLIRLSVYVTESPLFFFSFWHLQLFSQPHMI